VTLSWVPLSVAVGPRWNLTAALALVLVSATVAIANRIMMMILRIGRNMLPPKGVPRRRRCRPQFLVIDL
jgi:hypothetical protein